MADNPHAKIGNALISVLRRLRDRHPDMTLMQAQAFMHVAASPGITQIELSKVIEASDSAASRVIAMLTKYGSRNVAGMDLVAMELDLDDRRIRRCVLTAKGRRLMDEIKADLGG